MTIHDTTANALGVSYQDLCTTPACPACSLWPAQGETRADWLARLGELYRTSAPTQEHHRREGAA